MSDQNKPLSDTDKALIDRAWDDLQDQIANGCSASSCSPDVVSWDQWKQTLDERDEARREIERVKRLVRMLDDSPKSLLNHLVSWANK